jgi:hypothetical protein
VVVAVTGATLTAATVTAAALKDPGLVVFVVTVGLLPCVYATIVTARSGSHQRPAVTDHTPWTPVSRSYVIMVVRQGRDLHVRLPQTMTITLEHSHWFADRTPV